MSLTKSTKSVTQDTIKRDWFVIDATDKVLGRVATDVANRLRGKHKAEYTPHLDTGDNIIIINAEKIRVTGNKAAEKKYFDYSGYPGGMRETTFAEFIERNPTEVIRRAVKGMLGRGALAHQRMTKLKIYAGAEHPHAAQQPQVLS